MYILRQQLQSVFRPYPNLFVHYMKPDDISYVLQANLIVMVQDWATVKTNHCHNSTGVYHDSEYYYNSTECH